MQSRKRVSLRGPSGPRQSVPRAGTSDMDQLPKERIATPPAVARNDRGNRNPGAGHRLHLSLRGSRATRQSAPNRVIARRRSRRGNLRAAIDEKFQVNDTSRRLPRPLRGLAMTSVICRCLRTGGHTGPPLRTKNSICREATPQFFILHFSFFIPKEQP